MTLQRSSKLQRRFSLCIYWLVFAPAEHYFDFLIQCLILYLLILYGSPPQVQWRRDPIQPNGHRVRQKDDIWEKNRRAADAAYWGEWQQKSWKCKLLCRLLLSPREAICEAKRLTFQFSRDLNYEVNVKGGTLFCLGTIGLALMKAGDMMRSLLNRNIFFFKWHWLSQLGGVWGHSDTAVL